MLCKIENEFLSVEINSLGAELFSIKSVKTGVEYLWQGNPEFWKSRATVLFPVCGRIFGGYYTYNNQKYEMPIHGFSKLYDFSVNKESDTQISFTLISSEETKKYYPFDFSFTLKYALKGNALINEFIVNNTGDKELIFSYGGHPGFNVPFNNGEKFTDYYLEFSENNIEKLVFSDTCFNTGKTLKLALDGNKLNLSHDLFDNDAIFIKTSVGTVKLKSAKAKNYIEVSYKDMTCLGLWHKPKSQAPYVCIEPWHGVPSFDGVIDELTTKNQTIKLSKNKEYQNQYAIKICEE